ncbi:MAG: biotin carboxylase [Chloroflexi bacterium]|nr:biotin carboxylase [Chloroflexota bacterium]
MFSKIMIANRGEIACRVIRTCRKLGIKTVAVYSEVDRTALHVRLADEAYLIGEAAPQDSYLNMDRILKVAHRTGADAVHPGYGFLSENPEFARRCQEDRVRFIGPSAEVMEKMGDKLLARKLAKKAGLPVLPGTGEAVEDCDAEARALKLGYPLVVKAAEGGGGIGIHVLESAGDLLPVIERTRQVAANAFGSPRLYFEHYLKDASHVEVQLIGDEQGNLVHLLERDCSVQRRNQKLVEETPATKLDPKLRSRIFKLALKLGNYIGYTNAGTVEFLVSSDQQVYFLEMNTRLQVEHGVTELITGLDLVELQIRVAAGEPLPICQKDVRANGHAVEVRVYPEDPITMVPEAGAITQLHWPSGEHIRIDSALCTGYEVGLHYEPLLAKVMAWGESRDRSVKRLLRALSGFRFEGTTCNLPLLREILSSQEFATATYHTGSLATWLDRLNCDTFDYKGSHNGNHHGNGIMPANGKNKSDREIAAAIAVSMALAFKASSPASPRPAASNAWRSYGRREQLLSRSPSSRSKRSRGWR